MVCEADPEHGRLYNGEIMEIPLTEETVGGYEEKWLATRTVRSKPVWWALISMRKGLWAYKTWRKYYLVYAAGGFPNICLIQ